VVNEQNSLLKKCRLGLDRCTLPFVPLEGLLYLKQWGQRSVSLDTVS
jgi:hypothetical protein